MNWSFYESGVKPKHLEECFAIDSRERQIIPCIWIADENQFWSQDGIFSLGPFEGFDNYILAWIPTDEFINDYMEAKSKQNAK